MRFFVPLILALAVMDVASAANSAGRGRVSMADQMMAAPRATVSKNQINAMAAANHKSSLAVTPEVMQPAEKIDMREDEKNACIGNNVGVGNTFVWASRYSNTDNYSMMLEDTENPENNTCFVRVELKSRDPKIDVSDFEAKYYEMGQNIKCAEWVEEEDLRQRILDAKKSKRAWATVGGAVGGAAIGVGAMELFGNKILGGKVEGQKDKDLKDEELRITAVKTLQKENPTKYNAFVDDIKKLKAECDKQKSTDNPIVKSICEEYKNLFDEFTKTETTKS
jgi:hypothetical protein